MSVCGITPFHTFAKLAHLYGWPLYVCWWDSKLLRVTSSVDDFYLNQLHGYRLLQTVQNKVVCLPECLFSVYRQCFLQRNVIFKTVALICGNSCVCPVAMTLCYYCQTIMPAVGKDIARPTVIIVSAKSPWSNKKHQTNRFDTSRTDIDRFADNLPFVECFIFLLFMWEGNFSGHRVTYTDIP